MRGGHYQIMTIHEKAQFNNIYRQSEKNSFIQSADTPDIMRQCCVQFNI